jgi:homeobox-leucine zipper protein
MAVSKYVTDEYCGFIQVVSLTEKLQEKEATEGGASAATDAAALPAVDDVKASLADGVEEPTEPAEGAAAFEVQQVKSEDRLSTGSGGSAVVDADALLYGAGGRFAAAVDSSVESYFPGGEDHHYHDCGMGPVNHGAGGGIQSDDDGAGSDEGCSYYAEEEAAAAAAFFAGHTHHHADDDEDAGQISWWMWN